MGAKQTAQRPSADGVMHFAHLFPLSLYFYSIPIVLGRAESVDKLRLSSPLKLWQWIKDINVRIMSGFLSTQVCTYSF